MHWKRKGEQGEIFPPHIFLREQMNKSKQQMYLINPCEAYIDCHQELLWGSFSLDSLRWDSLWLALFHGGQSRTEFKRDREQSANIHLSLFLTTDAVRSVASRLGFYGFSTMTDCPLKL